jgi:hypothetical protein
MTLATFCPLPSERVESNGKHKRNYSSHKPLLQINDGHPTIHDKRISIHESWNERNDKRLRPEQQAKHTKYSVLQRLLVAIDLFVAVLISLVHYHHFTYWSRGNTTRRQGSIQFLLSWRTFFISGSHSTDSRVFFFVKKWHHVYGWVISFENKGSC